MVPSDPELARLLDDLRPAELALRDWVRTRLNASIVREIAALDYGMRVDEHRLGIEELLVARRLPEDLPWAPAEVLELSAYATPPDGHPDPGSPAWRGHVARLFSTLVLVRATVPAHPAGVLAGLVASALALGPEATASAVRYLAWCRLHEPGAWRDNDEARPFLTLGLRVVYAVTPDKDPPTGSVLRRAFTSEVPPADTWWPAETPTAALKATTGAPAWRIWRALVDRHLTAADDRPPAPGSGWSTPPPTDRDAITRANRGRPRGSAARWR